MLFGDAKKMLDEVLVVLKVERPGKVPSLRLLRRFSNFHGHGYSLTVAETYRVMERIWLQRLPGGVPADIDGRSAPRWRRSWEQL